MLTEKEKDENKVNEMLAEAKYALAQISMEQGKLLISVNSLF